MSDFEYIQPERLWLKAHPTLNERWVQDRIADDPRILGLGDLILKDKERMQPRAGRLDLLLQHTEESRRYEVEVQLGATDESHIIRTIEYWDIERKRYPQYEHTAVIVAENITSRFLNVVSLLNGTVPLMAIQMSVLRFGNQVALTFTTVLDVLPLGLVDEDEEVQEPTDRNYWEGRIGTKTTVGLADHILALLQTVDPVLALKYNKFYIGLSRDGQPQNFVVFRPKKKWMDAEFLMPRSEEWESRIEAAGLDIPVYDTRKRRYKVRLVEGDVKKHADLLTDLLQEAHDLYVA